jgi:hypothetical protein
MLCVVLLAAYTAIKNTALDALKTFETLTQLEALLEYPVP